jgi:hypothetical protein
MKKTDGLLSSEKARRYRWAVAAAAIVAGLAGVAFAFTADRGYTATAYLEVVGAPSAPASNGAGTPEQVAAVELLDSREVRAAVAAALGTSVGRMRTIDTFVPADVRLVGVRVSGHSARRVQRIADLAVDAASKIQRDRTGIEAQVVPGGLRERGLKPVETGLAAAVGGLVLALCAGLVMLYFSDQEAEQGHGADRSRASGSRSTGFRPA